MTSLKQPAALIGMLVACALALASGAAAAGGLDPTAPPPPIRMPNLAITAASVAPYGATQWRIDYTVANRGTGPAPAFHVAVQANATTLIKDTAYASLNAGASRAEQILITRTSCYLAIRILADSTHVVTESPKYDNERWAVGLEAPRCASQPKYKVKAVSFHAVDESGTDWLGSDEPYWIFNAVGQEGTERTTRSHLFDDVDTGENRSFGSTDGCLYLSCDGGPAPFGIGFAIELWEHDYGDLAKIVSMTRLSFEAVGALLSLWDGTRWAGEASKWAAEQLKAGLAIIWGDDQIGGDGYAYDPPYLARRLPAVGSTFQDTRTYGSSEAGAIYTLTIEVTRVA